MNNQIKSSILEVIGSTPIVELKKIKEKYGLEGRIFCKLEYLNPSHSKKDRMAKTMIQLAKERNELKDGQSVVEATSGNTGIALSMICAYHGHPFTAFMSEGNSSERIKMMEFFGTDVVIVPQSELKYGSVTGCDFDNVKNAAKKFAQDNGAFFVNQFGNVDNAKAQLTFGKEIVNTFKNNEIELGLFCDYVGTGGSFGGASKEIKEHDPNIKCYVVEPENSAVLSEMQNCSNSINSNPSGHHIIQGGGYGYKELPNLNMDLVDDFILIKDQESKDGMKELAVVEGIFGSFSSGANLMATIKAMKMEGNVGKNAVFSICDTGLKYLSVL